MARAKQPLDGITVVDCSQIFAGPFAGMIMADFGADVIKIEHPDDGDGLRQYGEYDEELAWSYYNRNKRSVAVDLGDEDGREVFKDIVADADVLIETFRPGTLEGWGIGWDTLSELNPDLVMVRVSGFGQTGPYKHKPGFGTLAESMSGFAEVNGYSDTSPTLPSMALADKLAGTYATFSTMFALYWRDVGGGEGQYIDVSLLEPLFAIMGVNPIQYDVKGIVPTRTGNSSKYGAPRNVYQTGDDEWVAISAATDPTAMRVLRMVGGDEMVEDDRFESLEKRLEHREELDARIQEWMDERTREEVIAAFDEHDVTGAPIYNIEDIFDDEYFWSRETLVNVEDDEFGDIAMPGIVPKLSEAGGEITHTGPDLGEHTADVLEEKTGLSNDAVRSYVERYNLEE